MEYEMENKNNSLATFINQYQLSKTLRFELKPIGKTAEWIEKHDIIGVKEDKLIGKDAEKAKHYKYAKRLLDSMHRVFIEDALSKVENDELKNKLSNKLLAIASSEGYELEKDKELQKLFQQLLDETADNWIQQFAEDMPQFWLKNIEELDAKILVEKNNQQQKKYKNVVKAIEKKLINPLKDIGKTGIAALHANVDAMQLLEWKILTGEVTATYKELEQNSENESNIPTDILCDYLRGFRQFYTYFTGFNENRQNVYDVSGAKSTSIINRTFKDNFSFHLANIQKWQTVKKSLERNTEILLKKSYDWKSELSKIETLFNCSFDEIMTVDIFICFMNQTGIDEYNKCLGGQAALDGSLKIQGLNEFINLSRQQAGAKRSQFPPMQEFYKQILSKSDKTFIPEFSDDHDMFNAIQEFHQEFFIQTDDCNKNIFDKFFEETKELASELTDDYENLYLAKDKLTGLSNELTGHWNNLNSELLEQLGENIFNKRKYFSFSEIEVALTAGCLAERFEMSDSYQDNLITCLNNKLQKQLSTTQEAWQELVANGVLDEKKLDSNRTNEDDTGFEQIAVIKNFLDASIAISGTVRDWQASKEMLKIDSRNRLWYDHIKDFVNRFKVIGIYNMVRNHVTKKPSATEKLKINFENSTFLDGWDRNKESDNYGVLLEKDSCFYLAVMTPHSNRVFDYEVSPKDSAKKAKEKKEFKQRIITKDFENCYRKINYKLLPGANKMLPKVFFAKSNENLFKPSKEIQTIKNEKLYSKAAIAIHGIQNLHDYIDFCKQSLMKHPEWSQAFKFTKNSFTTTKDYRSVDQFYREVEMQGYSIAFDNISTDYIDKKIDGGELYLFQIYNKDFSRNKKKKGTDNLHTIYWKGLFAPENLENTVLKLNGQAEIFFRQASIKYSTEKMKIGHHAEELKGKFNYPIIKDKRFTQNKFFFHCPITLNFGAPGIPVRFNDKVRNFLKNNSDVNIIGIDRGEKHLLYYSVINQKGEIIEQGSLNEIANGFIPGGESVERKINYHAKLDKIEQNRDKARKSWATIENIKEMKAGYLSQVVHKLAELIIQHNAIVVLEDLNVGFKRGRFGVEKQVYQKFEKALIDKLNYLVFKNEKLKNVGSYLNAYQLTNKFESFQKVGKQSGILFYTTASYTSTTDPVTGFLKNVYAKYQSIDKSIDFWKSFDFIIFNQTEDRFEFTYTLGKITNKSMYKEKDENEKQLQKRIWTVCSCVTRSRYIKAQEKQNEEQKLNTSGEQIGNKGKHEIFLATDKIKEILNKANIDFISNSDVKSQLLTQQDKATHSSMIYAFNAVMTMRVTDSSAVKGSKENDFIQSPVEPFFDSRYATAEQPENGDANGAYNIARKGLCVLGNINNADDVNKADIAISKQQWQEYVQAEEMVKLQKSKL
jgi:RuvC nuclease domain/Alpha helical recognition lobe domain/CRISPR-associated endonuclease Cpf1 PI domain/Nuclease domain/CRISPR-associated endonuclease Cpf1 REC2 domain